MQMVRWRRTAGGVAAAAVLLFGCTDGESTTPPTAATVPDTTSTLPPVDLDREKASRVVLTAADVPGFTVGAPDASENETIEQAANACVNNNPVLVRLGEDDDPRGAASPDFRKGNTQSVGSSVTFGETEDEARSAITALSAASYPGCFSEAATAALRTNPTFADVTVSTTRLPTVAAGDQSIGYRSAVAATVAGTAVTFFVDFTFVRTGRAFAVINDLSLGTPFPEDDRIRLATAIAGRMAGP